MISPSKGEGLLNFAGVLALLYGLVHNINLSNSLFSNGPVSSFVGLVSTVHLVFASLRDIPETVVENLTCFRSSKWLVNNSRYSTVSLAVGCKEAPVSLLLSLFCRIRDL